VTTLGRLALVLGSVVIAGVLATYPLVKRLGEAIPTAMPNCLDNECAENLLCVWIVGEGGRRLYQHPLSLFDANIFYPFRHTLAYADSMLSAGALVAPLNAITGNPILGYDLYYLATYVLSALGAYLLVGEITGDARAGLLAGWLFALSPEHWRYHGFLPAISVQWVPFVLYTWIRFLEMPGTGRGIALAAALMAHLGAGTYHGVMLPALLVPWALVLLVTRCWSIRRWLLSAAVLGPALAAGLLFYLPYIVVRREIEFDRPVLGWASDYQYWGPFVHPLAYLGDPRDSAHFFVSPLPFVFLAIAGIASAFRRHPIRPAPRREGRHLVAALIFTFVAAAVSLGVNKVSVAGLFAVPGPFFYLHRLPGFDYIRAPNRYTMLVACGGALVGGIAIAVTLRRVRSQAASLALALLFGSIIVLDARIWEPMPLTHLSPPSEVPAVYRWLATTPEGAAVLEYPLAFFGGNSVYMFYSLYHGHPLLNGYSGIIPRFDDALNGFPDDVSLRTLQDAGISYVIVHTDRLRGTLGGDMLLARLAHRRDLARRWFGADCVVFLSPVQGQRAEPVGDALDPHAWTVWASSPGAERVADGSLDTHWTTSTVTDESFLEIDLGAQHSVTGCTLRLGPHMEYPRQYRVLSSVDGVRWDEIGGEQPTVPPFASYRRDHLDVELPLRMRPTEARYLKIDVPADPPSAWLYSSHHWGAHEVSVYGK